MANHFIVVGDDGETWFLAEDCTVYEVTPKQMGWLQQGEYPKMLRKCKTSAVQAQTTNATPAQLKLAARLLDIAAEKFSRHICNDFDLVKQGGLTVEEAREIQELVNRGKSSGLSVADSDRDDLADVNSTHGDDWIFMCAVAKALKEGL